ncbi:MAG: class I SAM-dependent methyltransferase [Clostridia bacterium]|nr:class I SAM-dependent methyltransferase [Clostridia bacterium]
MYDGALSCVYDKLIDFDYEGYFRFISPYLKGKGVDLGCGSGTMTSLIGGMGCQVHGIDTSVQMLSIAASKGGSGVEWIHGDMSLIANFAGLNFVTCVCDGFNYLTDKKMSAVIAKAKDALISGGALIFDISSEKKLKAMAQSVYFFEQDGISCGWCNYPGKGCVDMQLTFFVDRGDGLYERGEENQRQYIHRLEDVKAMLSGFRVRVYDGESYGKVKVGSDRLLLICIKK